MDGYVAPGTDGWAITLRGGGAERAVRAPFQRADGLVDGLAEVLLSRPADPFAVDVVAVPAKGVERWLTQRLSHVLGARDGQGDGVCANVAFPHPSGLVAGAVATTAGILPADDPWERGRLLWTLLEVIDEWAAEDWCSTLAGHLGGGDETASHRRGRRLTAAQHLARLFDSYGADRPSMLRAWATGDDTDGVGALVAYGGAVSSRVASGVDLFCRCRVGARWRTSVRQHRTVGPTRPPRAWCRRCRWPARCRFQPPVKGLARPALCRRLVVVVEPDIIGTDDRSPRRRPRWALPVAALAAVALAVVVIGSNARQPPRPAPPTPSPAPTAVPNDFDLLAEGGPCVAGAFRDGRLTYVFGLVNISSQPVEVLSVSRKAAGVALIATRLPTRCDTDRAAPAFAPFRLDPGKSRLLLLAYRVTDCAAARSAGPTPVTVMAGGRNGPTRSGLIDLPSSVSGPCT